MGRIQWQAEYESLGALEETTRKTMADPGYRAIVARAGELFVEPSTDSIAISI